MSTYNKLVRDKIPQILDQKGIAYECRTASQEEYESELLKKLTEEVQEFAADHDLEELADVIEVINAIKGLPRFKDVESIRIQKHQDRGGFKQRIILKGTYS